MCEGDNILVVTFKDEKTKKKNGRKEQLYQILFLLPLQILTPEEIDKWKQAGDMHRSITFPRMQWTQFCYTMESDSYTSCLGVIAQRYSCQIFQSIYHIYLQIQELLLPILPNPNSYLQVT